MRQRGPDGCMMEGGTSEPVYERRIAMNSSSYEKMKAALEEIGSDLETETFVPEARWLKLERDIENQSASGGISPEESIDLRQLLDELRLEHDLRMNPGTLGS